MDLDAATLTVTGTVIRERGRGLVIQDVPKTTAGLTQDVYVGRGTASPRTAAVIRRAL